MSDNIVHLPSTLERRAQKINAALEKRDNARVDWMDCTLEVAVELAAARRELPSNSAFGEWCEFWFGKTLPKTERAILIQWGEDPARTKEILWKTERTSIQLIHENEWRLPNSRKTTPAREEKPSPIRESAKVAIRAHKATIGEYPTRHVAFEKYGVSSIVFERAIGEVTTEDKAATAPILQFTKAQERDIEARVEARRRELQASFERAVRERVRATLNEILATRDAEDAEAVRLANEIIMHSSARAPFTAGEYTNVLLRALHPDTTTPENRMEAFKLVNNKKVLLRAEGRIEIRGRIPAKSMEEWEAAKRAAALVRKRKPAASP